MKNLSCFLLLTSFLIAGCAGDTARTEKTHEEFKSPAGTPPMGWNSWNCAGIEITEAQVREVADYMAEHLREYGWEYVVIDAGWYHPAGMKTEFWSQVDPPQRLDAYGRLLPDTVKFPSASGGNGFRPLADYILSKGLKFGIHIMRGIPWNAYEEDLPILGSTATAREIGDSVNTCEWAKVTVGVDMEKPGSQEYYNSLFALYESWGVDYVKADDMSRPYRKPEIEAVRKAIQSVEREIVLSLSPGAAPVEMAEHLHHNAHLWRISGDFWDSWRLLKKQFDYSETWYPHIAAHGWPDADMLPLGLLRMNGTDEWVAGLLDKEDPDSIRNEYSRLIRDEKMTMMNLWSIFRSPLMFGGYLPENDSLSLELITNGEMLYVNQESTNNRQLYRDEEMVIWTADDQHSEDRFIAMFNVSEEEKILEAEFRDLGLAGNEYAVADLWSSGKRRYREAVSISVAPHGSFLGRIIVQR